MDFDAERDISWAVEHVISPPPTYRVRCSCYGRVHQRDFVLDDGLGKNSDQFKERLEAHKELIREAIRKEEVEF